MGSPRLSAIVAVGLCVASVAIVGSLELQRRAGTTAATVPAAPSAPAPVAQVADAVRQLKLVTWQFDTGVSAQAISDRWYGDAVASVRAPVRYQYGVDLADLRREDVIFDPVGDRYVFIVKPPIRIAAEVDLAKLEETLKVSGVRWKAVNQGQLEDARKRLAQAANDMRLSPEDATRLRDVSREQLEGHLTNVLAQAGKAGQVSVRFAD